MMNKPRIYIEEIELENFESHEHTVLTGFSQGFNCIAGLSDTGKTSVIRAVKLCAYNEFDQKMVRVGATNCRVKITTNIGSVEVQKGPDSNLWLVTRKDTGKTIKLDKTGRSEVKQACDVLGMKIVRLGETDVPINIMDQLEKHFFIDGIGDKKTTGSSRAEIIDEICGLNGAEELIRAISLDKYRLTRDVTEAENRITELQGKLFSDVDLVRDKILLAKVEKLEQEIQDCEANIDYLNQTLQKQSIQGQKLEEVQERLDNIDFGDAESLLRTIEPDVILTSSLSVIQNKHLQISSSLELVEKNLLGIPQLSGTDLQDAKALTSKYERLEGILRRYKVCCENYGVADKQFREIPKIESVDFSFKEDVRDYERAKQLLRKVEDINTAFGSVSEKLGNIPSIQQTESTLSETRALIADYQRKKKLYLDYSSVTGICKLKELEKRLQETDAEIQTGENKLSSIYQNITVCPVTKKPIGNSCSLVEMKTQNN